MPKQNNTAPASVFAERREFERKLLADAKDSIRVMCMADGTSPTAELLSLLSKALIAAHEREDAVLTIASCDAVQLGFYTHPADVWNACLHRVREAIEGGAK